MAKVGITYVRITYEIKQLMKALETRGLEYELIDDRKIWFPCARADLSQWEDIPVFLIRSLSASHGYYSALLLEHHGKQVINTARCLDVSGDKLKTTLALDAAGIPTPTTMVAFHPDAALKGLADFLHYPAVIKPLVGSWGNLIAKLETPTAAAGILEDRQVMGSPYQKIAYLQEFIERGADEDPTTFPRDLRVIVVGDEALGAMGRFEASDDFRSNVARGGRAEAFELSPEIVDLAIQATRAVHADMAGVDLMYQDDEWRVIEVNGTPQFRGFRGSTRIPVADHMVEYLETYLEQ